MVRTRKYVECFRDEVAVTNLLTACEDSEDEAQINDENAKGRIRS